MTTSCIYFGSDLPHFQSWHISLTKMVLKTDAMISACLSQVFNSIEKPVAFTSRVFSPTEKCYSFTEREAWHVYGLLKDFISIFTGITLNSVLIIVH